MFYVYKCKIFISFQIQAKSTLLKNDKYPDCVRIGYNNAYFAKCAVIIKTAKYEYWNFNSGNYLFTTDTK